MVDCSVSLHYRGFFFVRFTVLIGSECYIICLCSSQSYTITASPPHTDHSVLFARWRQCAPHVTHASLGPPVQVYNPNGISIGSAIFAHLTVECFRACPDVSFPLKIAPSHGAIRVAMLYNGPPILPSILPLPMGYLDTHLIHGSLSPQPKQHLNQFSHFCRVHGNYDRLTDHATGSVTIGCIYVHSTAMPPNTTSHFFSNWQAHYNCFENDGHHTFL